MAVVVLVGVGRNGGGGGGGSGGGGEGGGGSESGGGGGGVMRVVFEGGGGGSPRMCISGICLVAVRDQHTVYSRRETILRWSRTNKRYYCCP